MKSKRYFPAFPKNNRLKGERKLEYDLLLKNGIVVDPHHNINKKLDIGIIDGKIAGLQEEYENTANQVIDLQGKTVIPGVVDMHTHVSRKFGNVGYRMIAETGVTTTIDFAGPVSDIVEDLGDVGCGLNVGAIEAILPGHYSIKDENPSSNEIKQFLESALERGALGLKLFGGHAPLTPEATEEGINIANKMKVMVAIHAGSTETRSDMTGMREAIKLAKGKQLILAHVNAYCRGRTDHPLEELKEAFQLLKENPNVIGDSHLAVMNGTSGLCKNGVPHDHVTKVCLQLYGFPVTKAGLGQAIKSGIAGVIKSEKSSNRLIHGDAAYTEWENNHTNISVSFPANIPTVAVACATERKTMGGDFLIPVTSTDGGGIPRNNLVKRILSLYQMGYLSLEDVVQKISLNPANTFGLVNKGHLGIGADADITVLDLEKSQASMSFIGGRLNMKDGIVIGKGGKYLITEAGVQTAKKANLSYEMIDPSKSFLYLEKTPV